MKRLTQTKYRVCIIVIVQRKALHTAQLTRLAMHQLVYADGSGRLSPRASYLQRWFCIGLQASIFNVHSVPASPQDHALLTNAAELAGEVGADLVKVKTLSLLDRLPAIKVALRDRRERAEST